MKCDAYRGDLLEAAAVPGELKEQVRGHVEECPQCRAILQREQRLFAAVDEALRARMEDVPRAGFLADVRARISQEPGPRASMNPWWALAAASVIVVLLALAIPRASLQKQPVAVATPTISTSRSQAKPRFAESAGAEARHDRGLRLAKRQVTAKNLDRQPEVLVPPDEREALAKFVMHLRQRDEIARALASSQVDENSEFSAIKPVEIARLQLKRLVWKSWAFGDDRQGEEER
jgi:hypothetical protein